MSRNPGEPYRPSNGSEGMIFEAQFCDRCRKQPEPEDEKGNPQCCPIWLNSMAFEKEEPDYPKEWVYDAQGEGVCTAFDPKDSL